MLTTDNLQKLAIKNQTTELNIRREYVQHLFLSNFYQQPASTNIFFKGGTALKLLYASPRFSEDLDFSAVKSSLSVIENLVEKTLIEIERQGIKAEIVESKKTSGGYLAIIEFIINQEKISVQIEISFRDKNIKGEVITVINDFIPSYIVIGLAQQQLIEQKIQALLSRKKPRDFYDLYFILRANLISQHQKKILPEIVHLLNKTDIRFSRELKIFLPKSHWSQIRDFKEVLEREIGKYV